MSQVNGKQGRDKRVKDNSFKRQKSKIQRKKKDLQFLLANYAKGNNNQKMYG